MPATSNSPYDSFAWFYDRYWAAAFQEWQKPALEKLLMPGLDPGAHVLDLCCGTGQLARRLSDRGYAVTGVDSSIEMLKAARGKSPHAQFLHADATSFSLPDPVAAAVCTFDSLNHLTQHGYLRQAFRNVFEALQRSGHFVFDINTAAAYGERWNRSASVVEPDHAFFLRGAFDSATRTGVTLVTMFRLNGSWRRFDIEVKQRPWEVDEIVPMLLAAGFTGIETYRATQDLGLEGPYGIGRVYVRACRQS